MDFETSLNRYLTALVQARPGDAAARPPVRPFLTISRESGAGAVTVGQKVVEILNQQPQDVPWTLFDRSLVDVVLEKHDLPQELSKYLTEDAVNTFESFVDDLFGLHPPAHSLVRKTNETIVALAKMGKTILVGRGANFLTRKLEGGFHVRLVASRESRLRHYQEYFDLSDKEAAERLKSADESRKNYVRDVFGKDVDDLLFYDCVINTTWISYDAAARIIAAPLLG